MKIALAQLNYHVGNFAANVLKIKNTIRKAKECQADIVVFAELSVCGYPPRDFLEFSDFIEQCHNGIDEIACECTGIAAIIGAPGINPNEKGKPLFNSAYFLAEGKVWAIRHKSLLPNYDVFDEYRYFEPNRNFEVINYHDQKIALTICEDLWNIDNDPLYTVTPMDVLSDQRPTMMINIAASPFHYNQDAVRKSVLTRNAQKYGLPLVYVNHVGAQTELIFDGGSLVVDKNGNISSELSYFEEDFKIIDIDEKTADTGYSGTKADKIQWIHDALVLGIHDYFGKMGFQKAILGLSGGIDSAVTLALASQALGNKNCLAVLLPSRFSSNHSVNDARLLAENLNVSYHIISIEEAYKSLENTLQPYFAGLPFGLAEENVQARIRAVILMALSNKFGYILLNTSNKSEAAVGYGTLYGDMCGGLSVLGDVYKTDVFALARYLNRNGEIIPENTIIKPPSAELRPGQKDSDSLPEYSILDRILFQYIEERKSPRELIDAGFDETIVRKVLRMVNTNEWKRYQTPPILRTSPKAFGMGRRMPIVGKYLF
ncbi:MAG: NAD+ synthase [Lentimicrobiaceae bacterium]|nr:NAD+ synthase [Lentimicrobiaceae bacterium]